MADTDFGILIKAIDQASSTLKSVQGELNRLERASKTAATSSSSLNQAQQQLSATMSAVQRAISSQVPVVGQLATQMETVAAASAGVGGAVAGAAVAVVGLTVGLLAASKAAGDYQEHMDLAADLTGLTVREVGALTVAASNVGRRFEDIQPALSIFTRTLGDAQIGGEEASKKFRDFGISIRDAVTGDFLSTADVLENVAKRLDSFGTAAERNKALFELFGRSSGQILAILRQNLTETGDTAVAQGIVFTESQQKTAREADKAWDQLRLGLIGLRNQIVITFAPLGTALITPATGGMGSAFGGGIIPTGAPVLSGPGLFGPPPAPGTQYGPFLSDEMKKRMDAEEAFNKAVLDLAETRRKAEFEALSKAAEQREIIDRVTISGVPFGTGTSEKLTDPIKEAREDWEAMTREAVDRAGELRKAVDPLSASLHKASEAALSLSRSAGFIIANTVGSFVGNVIRGVQDIGQAFRNMILDILAQIASKAVTSGIISLLGLQSGGTLEPLRAQAGVIVSGVRGVDTVPILAGRGETIVSHTMTDRWDRVLSRLDSLLARPQQSDTGEATNPIEINVTVPVSGQFIDRSALQDFVQDELVSPLVRALGTGAWRRR